MLVCFCCAMQQVEIIPTITRDSRYRRVRAVFGTCMSSVASPSREHKTTGATTRERSLRNLEPEQQQHKGR